MPTNPAPQAIIFDLGNVVAYFDYRRAFERLSARTSVPIDELRARGEAADLAACIVELEHGRVDEQTFGRMCYERLQLTLDSLEFCSCWSDIFWLNDSVAQLVENLDKEGYRLVLGSNTNAIHARQFRQQFASTLRHFDHLILSHEVGHMKPAAGFYEACVAAAAVPAEHCVFVDDLAANVEGARSCGLSAILYRDTAALQCELQSMGVCVT